MVSGVRNGLESGEFPMEGETLGLGWRSLEVSYKAQDT